MNEGHLQALSSPGWAVMLETNLFIGTDGLDSEETRRFHDGDVFMPINPDTLGVRLEAIGFTDVCIEIADHDFRELRFHARKPGHDVGYVSSL